MDAFVPCFHVGLSRLTFVSIEHCEVDQDKIDVLGLFRLHCERHRDLNLGRLGVVAAVVIDEIMLD